MVDGVCLDFVVNLHRGGKRFRQVGEHAVHLGLCLEPLLLGIQHAVRVVEHFAGAQAYEPVVGLGILFISEVGVVGGDNLHVVFACEFYQLRLDAPLQLISLMIGSQHRCLMPLQLDVVVVAESFLPPCHALVGAFQVAGRKQFRQFAAETCRTYYYALTMGGNRLFVGARMRILSFGPCLTDYFYKIVIAFLVFSKEDEMAARVALVYVDVQVLLRHVHLAADNRLEYFSFKDSYLRLGLFDCIFIPVLAGLCGSLFSLFDRVLYLAVLFGYIVEKLLDAVHRAVVGYGYGGHAVGHRFVDEA